MPPIPIAGQVSHCDIKDWYEAWNKRDWVGVTRFLSPQFVLEDLALGRRIEGAAAYLTYAKTWARVFSDGEFKVERISCSGNRHEPVLVEYSMRASQGGQWGDFSPSASICEFRFCDILRFEHDRLVSCTIYGDYYRSLCDLGHLPRSGLTAAPIFPRIAV